MTKKWPDFLEQVVTNINNIPCKAIAGLKPADINFREDTLKVDKKMGIHPDISLETQKKQQEQYEAIPENLQVGNYVFLDFVKKSLSKGYDTSNRQLYIICQVLAGKRPVLYKLKDLLEEKIPGYYYGQQLTRAPTPKKEHFFKVEKVYRPAKRINGVKCFYVKFLHYPNKFNQYVKESDLIGDE